MKKVKRNYTITDSELYQLARELADILGICLPDLSKYNLTTEKIEELNDLALLFAEVLPDAYYTGNIKFAVQQRNAQRRIIAGKIHSVIVRAGITIPGKLLRYDDFAAHLLQPMTVFDFLFAAKDFHRTATEDLPALAEEGLTQAALDAFAADVAGYEARILEVAARALVRREKAAERVELGNRLYELVARYTAYGKMEYAANPAKYAAFIIYADAGTPRKTPRPPAVEVNDGYVEATFNQEVTSIRVWIKHHPDEDYRKIYEGENKPVFVGKSTQPIYVKVEGRNASGWGKSGEKKFVITN